MAQQVFVSALALAGFAFCVLGAANLLAALISIVLSRPFGQRTPPTMQPAADIAGDAFVSVHLATHDEPPAMVIATIEALANLDYPAFEVIVIDNNTSDSAAWQPVANRAAELGSRVRFYHRDGVTGAKAGALNIALELADPRTVFVAIVDADYRVAPDFLTRGVAACGRDVQFVQFPQVYRQAHDAAAVVAELSDYFETFPRAANRAQAALLTGTLSVISIDALRAVGGWPTSSITEDAQLGVALWSSGARGLFVNSNVGNGLLPVDLAGLRLQRQRWVRGNVQTLLSACATVLPVRVGTFAVIAQLTAWIGLLAVPLISLIAVAVVRGVDGRLAHWSWQAVEGLAITTIICLLLSYIIRALRRQQLASLLVTMSLLWTASFAWLSALGQRPLAFHRTPKTSGKRSRRMSLDTACSWIAAATAAVLAVQGASFAAATLALTASGLIAAPWVDRWLRTAADGRNHPWPA